MTKKFVGQQSKTYKHIADSWEEDIGKITCREVPSVSIFTVLS